MKASNSVLVMLVIAVWACILIVSFVIGLRKTVKPQPRQKAIDAARMKAKQRALVEDTRDLQRQSTESQAQRLKDDRLRQEQRTRAAQQQQEQILADQRKKVEDIQRRIRENRQRMRTR